MYSSVMVDAVLMEAAKPPPMISSSFLPLNVIEADGISATTDFDAEDVYVVFEDEDAAADGVNHFTHVVCIVIHVRSCWLCGNRISSCWLFFCPLAVVQGD